MTSFSRRWNSFTRLVRNLGFGHAARHKGLQLWHRVRPPKKAFKLTTRGAAFPLFCRPNTSDMEVFSQIFVGGEYRCLKPKSDPTMILDCGANVGYTAAYFLTRFPRASLIAVEPDPENAELLERNLRPYGRRAKVLRTAVWSHRTGMVLSTEPFGDGREWARHVREVKNGETPLLQATDIGSIIDDAGHQRVGILKIDIEGAEEVIFGSDCSRWIDRVDNIAVEVHSPAAKEAFIRATGSRFDLSQHGDITLATRVAE